MGASGWSYFTSYQENIVKAFQELQQKVFESGNYGHACQYSSEMLNQYPQLKASAEALKKLDDQRLKDYGPIKAIDDLRKAFAEEGTHTIIDIERIHSKPDFGVAYPAPQEIIQKVFGTPKPTHQDIESKKYQLLEALNIERWQATYLIVYENNIPKEIYFEGCSGD
jgi:hypothetical protein